MLLLDGIEPPKSFLMPPNTPKPLIFGPSDVFLLNFWGELLFFLVIIIQIKFKESLVFQEHHLILIFPTFLMKRLQNLLKVYLKEVNKILNFFTPKLILQPVIYWELCFNLIPIKEQLLKNVLLILIWKNYIIQKKNLQPKSPLIGVLIILNLKLNF